MKIATWNVNSVRSRLDRLVDWLSREQPDVMCLQELKTLDDSFPFARLEEIGYHAAVCCQKTYNGVAILSREPAKNIERGLGNVDPQTRMIAATIGGVRVISVYVPNGETVGSEKHAYKLDWLARLHGYLAGNCKPSSALVVCGDFNIAPADCDVARPHVWANSVLCDPEARQLVANIRDWGLVDVFRKLHPDLHAYSWWDYRMLAFQLNNGLRLDYILATQELADRCQDATIDREARKGDKPSDHAPVVAVFE